MAFIKSAFKLVLDSEKLVPCRNNYIEAQKQLYSWVDDKLGIYGEKLKGLKTWQTNSGTFDEDLVSETRTDFTKNTKTIGKTSRVGSTLILNNPCNDKNDYKDQKGENAGDIADAKFNAFLKQLKKDKGLNKSEKKEIKETIKTAKEANRVIEDMATLAFLETAIKSEIEKFSQKDFPKNPVATKLIEKFSKLNRQNIQTTGDALKLHEESTMLRKALEKEYKGNKDKAHAIKQLDILTKRYADICYQYPLKLNAFEKFAGPFTITSLIISNLSIFGAVATGIIGFFTAGATWPLTALFAKGVFAGVAPLIVQLINLGRNLNHGRLLIAQANMFTGMSIGVPAVMVPFNLIAMPHLIASQMHLIKETGHHVAKKLEISAGENSMNSIMFAGQSGFTVQEIKNISQHSKTALHGEDLNKKIVANNLNTQKTLIEKQADSKKTTKNLLTVMDYQNNGFFKEKTKNNNPKYTNFYVANDSTTSDLHLLPSRHKKIVDAQIGLWGTFGLFLNKKEWEVRRLKNQFKTLSPTDVKERKDLLGKIIKAIDDISTDDKKVGKTLKNLRRRAKDEKNELEKPSKEILALLKR